MPIKIWGRESSICTQRILWAAYEANIDVSLQLASATMGPNGHISRGVEPFGIVETDWYLNLNPTGAIPTIEDNDQIIWDSGAILVHFAIQHSPDKLIAGRIQDIPKAISWINWTNEVLEPQLHHLVMHLVRLPPGERDLAIVEEAHKRVYESLNVLEKVLDNRRWLAGDSFTIADIPAAATLYRWTLFKSGFDFPRGVSMWFSQIVEREPFKNAVSPKDRHL